MGFFYLFCTIGKSTTFCAVLTMKCLNSSQISFHFQSNSTQSSPWNWVQPTSKYMILVESGTMPRCATIMEDEHKPTHKIPSK